MFEPRTDFLQKLAEHPRQTGWSRILLLFLVALAARWAAIGNPIVHVDEQFYLTFAYEMLHGAVPYVDVWDRKQLGLFLVYVPAAAFGTDWGVYVYQAMALASVVATAAMIARAAERAGWGRGALFGAVAYIVWLDIADGQGGQTPVFYNALTVGAVLLVSGMPAGTAGRARGFVAMALIGLALQVKFSVVFEGLWIGLWLLWRARGAGAGTWSILQYGAGLVVVALVPTLLVAGWFWASGYWGPFVFSNFQSIALRHSDPRDIVIGNFVALVGMLAPLVVMGIAGRGRPIAAPDMTCQRTFLWGWLWASLLGLVLFGSYFNHYALPAMAPAACCASAFAAGGRRARIAAWGVVAVAFALGQFLVLHQRARRGYPQQFHRIVRDIGSGPGCLFVYAGEPLYYPATGRCTLTKFLFPSHLNSEREQGSIGVDQTAEIDRVLALRPAVVIVTSAYDGERMVVRDHMLARLVREGYRRTARDPLGEQTVDIYRVRR